jgi:hypothetical protein
MIFLNTTTKQIHMTLNSKTGFYTNAKDITWEYTKKYCTTFAAMGIKITESGFGANKTSHSTIKFTHPTMSSNELYKFESD